MAKSRSKKITIATLRGNHKELSDKLRKQWPIIAKSYCAKMNAAAIAECSDDPDGAIKAAAEQSAKWRETIFELTATCIDRVTIEERAPKLDDVNHAILRIAWAAGELKKALSAAQSGEGRAMIRSDIERRLMWPDGISMPKMERQAFDFARAARLASESISNESGTEEGQARDNWIAQLIKFANDNGLPTTISFKSSFVRFVENLRALSPNELGHHKDPGALSREIRRAIQNAKKRADAKAKADAKAEAERVAEEAEYIADYEREMAAKESRRESNGRSRRR